MRELHRPSREALVTGVALLVIAVAGLAVTAVNADRPVESIAMTLVATAAVGFGLYPSSAKKLRSEIQQATVNDPDDLKGRHRAVSGSFVLLLAPVVLFAVAIFSISPTFVGFYAGGGLISLAHARELAPWEADTGQLLLRRARRDVYHAVFAEKLEGLTARS